MEESNGGGRNERIELHNAGRMDAMVRSRALLGRAASGAAARVAWALRGRVRLHGAALSRRRPGVRLLGFLAESRGAGARMAW
jgi:hypothetical protein